MAKSFSEHERGVINKALIDSAQKHASRNGMRATSLDQLTADAGISKSAFYIFYETKEHLFLKVIEMWHAELIEQCVAIVQERTELPVKERLVQCLMYTLTFMDERSMIRFLSEDALYIARKIPEAIQKHYNRHDEILLPVIEAANIRFKVDFHIVSAMIHTLLYTLSNKDGVGDNYYEAIEHIIRATIEAYILDA